MTAKLEMRTPMPVTIRPLEIRDEARWRELWAGYLAFYKCPDLPAAITDHTWSMLMGSRPDVFGLVAEDDGRVIGIANCVIHANTWTDKFICYLEDLFVDPVARGQGAGRALIEGVYARAKQEGWGQVYWRTANANPARKLYDQVANEIGFVTYANKL